MSTRRPAHCYDELQLSSGSGSRTPRTNHLLRVATSGPWRTLSRAFSQNNLRRNRAVVAHGISWAVQRSCATVGDWAANHPDRRRLTSGSTSSITASSAMALPRAASRRSISCAIVSAPQPATSRSSLRGAGRAAPAPVPVSTYSSSSSPIGRWRVKGQSRPGRRAGSTRPRTPGSARLRGWTRLAAEAWACRRVRSRRQRSPFRLRPRARGCA